MYFVVCTVEQPGQQQQQPVVQWMPMPATMPGVPSGLEYLTQVDQLLVYQLVEILESKSMTLWRCMHFVRQSVRDWVSNIKGSEPANPCLYPAYPRLGWHMWIEIHAVKVVLRTYDRSTSSCADAAMWARGLQHCRISPYHFLADCRKRWTRVVLYFALFAFFELYLVHVFS